MTGDAHWLWVVGIGEDGWEGLNPEARRAVAGAEVLYGGVRHLGLVPLDASAANRVPWPSPMAPALERILTEHRRKTRVAVLASGDPMLYGVGVTLTRDLPATEFRILPQVSAFSLACARLGWPMAETTLVTVVHRPIEQVLRHLYPGERIIVFSQDGNTPATLARLLTEAGYGPSDFKVFENLGGPYERWTSGIAGNWPPGPCGPLNVIAIRCAPEPGTLPLSPVPGLPDAAFDTDGQLTKREIRAVTLSSLAPLPHQTLWDVGAGTGSIGIEWMRAHPSCSCTAFESREDRALRIQRNALRFGVPGMKVIQGQAPATFAGQPQPNAIFMGGDVCNEELFQACWANLKPGGRLVANAVTLQSEASLIARHSVYGGDLMRMTVSRAEPIGGSYGWRPAMPITQWRVMKP